MNDQERIESARRVTAALNAAIPDILAGLNAGRGTRRRRPDVPLNDPGVGRSAEWEAEDGWLIGYSTTRISGGKYDGKFVVTAHRPYGQGSRSGRGKVQRWELDYVRAFSTRKAAKARALQLYGKHSPRWAARTERKEPEDG